MVSLIFYFLIFYPSPKFVMRSKAVYTKTCGEQVAKNLSISSNFNKSVKITSRLVATCHFHADLLQQLVETTCNKSVDHLPQSWCNLCFFTVVNFYSTLEFYSFYSSIRILEGASNHLIM